MPPGRPVKKRTTKTYMRDVEAITRLRTAILLDQSLLQTDAREAVNAIDVLIEKIAKFIVEESTHDVNTGITEEP